MKKASELGLETIQLEDQVLLVEKNREYQTNGWAFNTGKGVFWVDMSDRYPSGYKFIASTKPLEGLPLLVIEDEMTYHESFLKACKVHQEDISNWRKGYNKAKETYKFTEEDLRKAYDTNHYSQEDKDKSWNSFIQSLTKKELWIEVERYRPHLDSDIDEEDYDFIPKITNNQIKAVWK